MGSSNGNGAYGPCRSPGSNEFQRVLRWIRGLVAATLTPAAPGSDGWIDPPACRARNGRQSSPRTGASRDGLVASHRAGSNRSIASDVRAAPRLDVIAGHPGRDVAYLPKCQAACSSSCPTCASGACRIFRRGTRRPRPACEEAIVALEHEAVGSFRSASPHEVRGRDVLRRRDGGARRTSRLHGGVRCAEAATCDRSTARRDRGFGAVKRRILPKRSCSPRPVIMTRTPRQGAEGPHAPRA
jgi:hypothetical protein